MLKLKTYPGNVHTRLKVVSDPFFPFFLLLLATLFAAVGSMSVLSLFRPGSGPGHVIWSDNPWGWLFGNLAISALLIGISCLHGVKFAYRTHRFFSQTPNTEIVKSAGQWIDAMPHFSAEISVVSVSEDSTLYDITITMPRTPHHRGRFGIFGLEPVELPGGVRL